MNGKTGKEKKIAAGEEALPESPHHEHQKREDVNVNEILVLTSVGGHREKITQTLKKECNLNAVYISDINKTIEMLNRTKCGYFLHDWEPFDKLQNHQLHQRIAKMESLEYLCRIVFSTKLTYDIFALTADVRIDRVITAAALQLNLGTEINAAKTSQKSKNPMEQKILAIHNQRVEYEQEKIDAFVEDYYSNFPHHPVAKIEYANLRYRQGKLEEAEEMALGLLKANPRNTRALTLVSRILMKQARFDEAFQVLEQANFLSPKNSSRLLLLGEVFYKKGDVTKARSYYKEAVESDPESKEAVVAYAEFEMGQENANEAIEFLQAQLSEEEVAGVFNNNAIHLVKQKKLDDGIKFYDLAINALKTDTFKPMIFFNMAMACKYKKDYRKALDLLNSALELKPDFEKAVRQRELLEKMSGKK